MLPKMCQGNKAAKKTMATDDVILSRCEKFVCSMYGFPGMDRVNKCRCQMFASKQMQSHCLPPCQDALKQHTMWANYQAGDMLCSRTLMFHHPRDMLDHRGGPHEAPLDVSPSCTSCTIRISHLCMYWKMFNWSLHLQKKWFGLHRCLSMQ